VARWRVCGGVLGENGRLPRKNEIQNEKEEKREGSVGRETGYERTRSRKFIRKVGGGHSKINKKQGGWGEKIIP